MKTKKIFVFSVLTVIALVALPVAGCGGGDNTSSKTPLAEPKDTAPLEDTKGYRSFVSASALAYDPVRNILYSGARGIGNESQGLWRCSSPDGSPSWSTTGRYASSLPVTSLAYDSVNNVLYAALDTASGEYDTECSIWLCTNPDTSATWEDIGGAVSSFQIGPLAYDPTHNILYAGTDSPGVLRCTTPNANPSWASIGGEYPVSSVLYDQALNILYAGTSGMGVWFCTAPDTSANWASTGGDFNGTGVDAIAYDASSDIIYAGTSGTGVRRCTRPRSSPTWQNISESLFMNGSNGISSLVYDSTRNFLYAGTYEAGGIVNKERGGVWRCANPGGSPSWTDTGALSSYYINCLAFDSGRDVLYAGPDAERENRCVFRCNNPDTAPSWNSLGGGTQRSR